MGKALRWKAADFDMLLNDEKEIRAALRARRNNQQATGNSGR